MVEFFLPLQLEEQRLFELQNQCQEATEKRVSSDQVSFDFTFFLTLLKTSSIVKKAVDDIYKQHETDASSTMNELEVVQLNGGF